MTERMRLQTLLPQAGKNQSDQLAVFGLLCLGLIESLDHGLISAAEAVRDFFHADNCLFLRKMRNKAADEIMSRGVQLPDLFDVLPLAQSQREFKRELAPMRAFACVCWSRKNRLLEGNKPTRKFPPPELTRFATSKGLRPRRKFAGYLLNHLQRCLHVLQNGQTHAVRDRQAPALEARLEHGLQGHALRAQAQAAAQTRRGLSAVPVRLHHQ